MASKADKEVLDLEETVDEVVEHEPQGLDISDIDIRPLSTAGSEMQVILAGVETGAYITYLGSTSSVFKAMFTKMEREKLGKRGRRAREETRLSVVHEVQEQLCLACAIGWRGWEKDGKPLPFSKEALKDVFARRPSIMEQSFEFISEEQNFLGGPDS